MKRGILVLSLALWSALAFALPSSDDVQSAVRAGNYGQAETMMQEVVAAKPQSAKAHYLYAEILAHEGKFDDAAAQAQSARAIDPAIGFTDPQKFRSFEQLLEREQHPAAGTSSRVIDQTAPAVQPVQHLASSAGGVPGWVWGAGIAIVMFLVFRAVMRRAGGMAAGNGGASYGRAPAPVWNGPNGGGYGMNGGAPMGGTSAGGSMLRTGLAAAGGVAAGMLAERYLEGQHGNADPGQGFGNLQPNLSDDGSNAASELESRPVDFGSGGGWGGDSSSDAGGGSSSDDGGGW